MLLRSSSNPVLQTLFSDSPNRDHHYTKYPQPPLNHCTTKLSHHHQHHHRHRASWSSSDFNQRTNIGLGHPHKGFRRALSDGNLEGLASTTTSFDLKDYCNLHKHSKSMLHTSPSFSIYTSNDGVEEKNEKEDQLEIVAGCIEAVGSGEFSFRKKSMALIEETSDEEEVLKEVQNMGIDEEEVQPQSASPPMYLATGLGIDGSNAIGGFGGDFTPGSFDEGGNVEEYYKAMLDEHPSNPLFLRNYAQLLESTGDLHRAEEYYFRATLADPKDGEILLLYAKLVWELHHDQDRALNYFERAAGAAPENSHILAAYACFLWEIDGNKEEDFAGNYQNQIEEDKGPIGLQNSVFDEAKEPVSPPSCLAAALVIDVAGEEPVSPPSCLAAALVIDVAGVGGSTGGADCITADAGEGVNVEEYYKRMVKENPSSPLFLRNYAQFLYQSKGDLKGAEEYYSRAILADPGDGEIISQYATLLWELHRDRDKASSYFERAVQAAPQDSHVLAAYAKFLWETEEGEEEDCAWKDHIQVPLSPGAMAFANA